MQKFKKILDEITCDSCNHSYCILKEILLRIHKPDERTLVQIKCIDKFKYEQSEKVGHDIGMDQALDIWVNNGYAKVFSEVYSDDMPFLKLYRSVIDTTEK